MILILTICSCNSTPSFLFFLRLFVEPWTWGFLSSLSSSACLSRWILHFILHKVRNHILKDLAVASCLSLHTRLQGLCVRAEPSQCPCPRRTLSPSDPTTEQSVCILDQKRNLSSSTLVIRIYVVFNNPPRSQLLLSAERHPARAWHANLSLDLAFKKCW